MSGTPDRHERRLTRPVPDKSHRTESKRDRDRVLYSDAFRRLAGVTQVAQGHPSMGLHNRLTHSLKVEQVGTSIYSLLRATHKDLAEMADPDAISAGCLAHDIGHPPFGHAGEEKLNEILVCSQHRDSPREIQRRLEDPCGECKLEDGFEGNAQSFRVITALAVHRDSLETPIGLNLSKASLLATSKYPWTKGAPGRKQSKWGAYDCDASTLEWVAGSANSDLNLDAQVMDWADDISYAVHDIEDFFRVGLIPIDDYKANTTRLETFVEYVESPEALGELNSDVRIALDNVLEYFPEARFSGRAEDIAVLDRLRSRLLDQFIGTTTLEDGTTLKRDKVQEGLNAVLKQFIWYHIIDDPKLANIQAGQQRVIGDIFDALKDTALHAYRSGDAEATGEKDLRRLPHSLRRAIDIGLKQAESKYTLKQGIYRGLVDYISGLSDAEAYSIHAVLRGREYAGHL